MTQYADSDDLALGATYHLLLRETEALEKTIATMLNIEPHGKSDSREGFGAKSFYRELDLRQKAGNLTPGSILAALRVVLKEVDRYRTTIANLAGYVSRDQPLRPTKTDLDLVLLLEEAIDVFEAPAFAKGVLIQLEAPPSVIIRADSQLMFRVFVNLLNNAIKYSYTTTGHSGQRHVDVQARRHSSDGRYLVNVTSYGVGITAAEIASGSIFEYGVRGELASDREREGTGIGLAECKRIVEAHGGTIRLKSEPRSAAYITTVSVVIPAN